MKYYKLPDGKDRSRIVRQENGQLQAFVFGADRWEPVPSDSGCECVEITEAEAAKLLDKQGEKLKRLAELALEVTKKAHLGQKDKGGNPYTK